MDDNKYIIVNLFLIFDNNALSSPIGLLVTIYFVFTWPICSQSSIILLRTCHFVELVGKTSIENNSLRDLN